MKKSHKLVILITAAIIAASSCNKGNNTPEVPSGIKGTIVLNNGNMGSNDACITLLEEIGKEPVGNCFLSANGQKLGDIAQDIIQYGNELYIAVTNSKVIFVTDLNLKIKTSITAKTDADLSPRNFCTGGGKIYVSYYEGYLGEIDPSTYKVRTVKVGLTPEGLAYVNGKIYVANSGGTNWQAGYDNTVSVVDASKFTEDTKITVNCNPQKIEANKAGTTLYVNSFGNYGDIPAKFQTISTADLSVSDCSGYTDIKDIAMGSDDTLYIVTGGYDENWNVAGTVWKHDAKTNSASGKLTDTQFSKFYSISTSGDYIYIGTGDYTGNGDMHILNKAGEELCRFDALGLYPKKSIYLGK